MGPHVVWTKTRRHKVTTNFKRAAAQVTVEVLGARPVEEGARNTIKNHETKKTIKISPPFFIISK
jgi:hypothetical protein